MSWVKYVPIQGADLLPSLTIHPGGGITLRKSVINRLHEKASRFDVMYDVECGGVLLVPSDKGTYRIPKRATRHGGIAQAVKLLRLPLAKRVIPVQGFTTKEGAMAFDMKKALQ